MAFKDKTQKEAIAPVAESAPVVEAEKLVEVQADFKMEEVNANAERDKLIEAGFKNAYVKKGVWLFSVIAEKCAEGKAAGIMGMLAKAGYTPYIL